MFSRRPSASLGSFGSVPLAQGASLYRGWTTVRLDAVFSAFRVNTRASTGDPPRSPTGRAHVDRHPPSGRGVSALLTSRSDWHWWRILDDRLSMTPRWSGADFPT